MSSNRVSFCKIVSGDLAQVHETANEFFEEASDLPPEQLAFLYAQLKEVSGLSV